MEAEYPLFHETDLDGSSSELAAKPSLYSDRQAAKSLSLDKSPPASDIVESNTRKDELQAKVPWPAHQLKKGQLNSSHGPLDAGSPEKVFVVAGANKPLNSRQSGPSLAHCCSPGQTRVRRGFDSTAAEPDFPFPAALNKHFMHDVALAPPLRPLPRVSRGHFCYTLQDLLALPLPVDTRKPDAAPPPFRQLLR